MREPFSRNGWRHAEDELPILQSTARGFSGRSPSVFSISAAATAAQSAHPEEASAQYTGFSMGTFIQGSFYAKDQKTADALPARFEKALFAYEMLFTVHAAGPMTELNKKRVNGL